MRHIAQLEAAEGRDLEVHEFVNQWSHLYPDEAVRWFQPETKILRSLVMVKDIQRMTDSSVRLVPKLKTWNTHKKVKKVNLVPVEHCKRNATGPHGDARPKKRPRPMPKTNSPCIHRPKCRGQLHLQALPATGRPGRSDVNLCFSSFMRTSRYKRCT